MRSFADLNLVWAFLKCFFSMVHGRLMVRNRAVDWMGLGMGGEGNKGAVGR